MISNGLLAKIRKWINPASVGLFADQDFLKGVVGNRSMVKTYNDKIEQCNSNFEMVLKALQDNLNRVQEQDRPSIEKSIAKLEDDHYKALRTLVKARDQYQNYLMSDYEALSSELYDYVVDSSGENVVKMPGLSHDVFVKSAEMVAELLVKGGSDELSFPHHYPIDVRIGAIGGDDIVETRYIKHQHHLMKANAFVDQYIKETVLAPGFTVLFEFCDNGIERCEEGLVKSVNDNDISIEYDNSIYMVPKTNNPYWNFHHRVHL